MNTSDIISMVNNGALLLALGLLYDMLGGSLGAGKSTTKRGITGLVLGAIGISVMMNPWRFAPGVVFDTRSVLLCVSGLFFGVLPTLLATMMMGTFRLYTGGTGAWTGVAVIVLSGAVGVAWRHLRRSDPEDTSIGELYILGLVVHLAMLLCMFSLPRPLALSVLSKISLPVMVIYPMITVLLGWLMVNRGARKRNEEALQESKRQLGTLMSNLPGMAYRGKKDPDWTMEFVSDGCQPLTGYKPEELVGRALLSYREIIHPEDRQTVRDVIQEALKNERPFQLVYRIVTADGEEKSVWEQGRHVFGTDGSIIVLEGFIADITERKRAEEALRESNEKLDALIQSSPSAIIALDSDGNITLWNPAAEKMFGWEEREVIGRFPPLIPEDKESEYHTLSKRVLRGERFYGVELRRQKKDGSDIYISNSTAPLRDSTGRIAGIMSIVEDITERERAGEALRQSEYALSIRNRISEIFLTRLDEEIYGEVLKVVLEVMKSKYGIFGYINEDGAWICPSMTRDIWDQCHIPDRNIIFPREKWGGIWGRAMLEKKSLYSNETFIVPEGHIPIVRALDVPIVYQGELIGNLLVGNKETDYGDNDMELLQNIADSIAPVLHSRFQIEKQEKEKKQLETQFHQAQKMKAIGTLAGGIAHDFNNLLTTIIGNADMALTELGPGDPLREDIGIIKEAGEKAASLTRQLLAFSRKQVIQLQLLDLTKVLADLEKMLRRMIGEDIDLSIVSEPELLRVYADSGQMEQIIMNLVVNARDAMPTGGMIRLEAANVQLDNGFFRTHGVEGPRALM